jgi:hypothetical protein
MRQLVIQLQQGGTQDACAWCGEATGGAAGPALFDAVSGDHVCRECGRKHAPSLVALLDLAGTAERVGRIGRHSVFPPLGALLDLARAAENYTGCAPRRPRAVA